eukprot:g5303.t1
MAYGKTIQTETIIDSRRRLATHGCDSRFLPQTTIIKGNWKKTLQDITPHILMLNGPALFSPEADTLFQRAACRWMSSKDRRLLTPKSGKSARPVKLEYRRKTRKKKDFVAFCEKQEC